MKWNIESCIIFECVFGSQVYGTSTEDSDVDYRGVCIPPWEIRNSLLTNFEQQDGWEGKFEDRTIYNLKKFLVLCKDANPAIIEYLFVPERFWKTCHSPWIAILENKNLFLSKKAKYTFSGYAHAQLQKIMTHRNWLLHPPKQEPIRENFGLPKNPRLTNEQISAIVSIPADTIVPEYREEAEKEKGYRQSREHWDKYMNWKVNRNPKRAALEEQFGYDTKHALHLVRLMREGEELLLKGTITFPRPEQEELGAILRGVYSYEQLMEKVIGYDVLFEKLYEESQLRYAPDSSGINELYLNLLKKYGGE
jgi:predicted nucleotidyltransferase